jgi:hypothetical protein
MKRPITTLAALLAWTAVPGYASDFDGSKLLVCANMEAAYCSSGQACDSGRPSDIGAPNFMRIDFANKSITGPDRSTAIVSIEKSAEQLLLQGTEFGYAWTLALSVDDGTLGATIVNRDQVVVLFGACTPH